MQISQKALDEFKQIWKEKYNKELTDAETYEYASNLLGFFDVLYKCEVRDRQRKHRLKTEPDGFPITDGIYDCCICHRQLAEGEGWYDRWHIKCPLCRKAVNEGIIPIFVCTHRDSWYATWQLDSKFGIKSPTARKLVRQGKLKARIVSYEDGKPYEYVFLKKENPELIDPDRQNPVLKSYHRNKNKFYEIAIREEKKKLRAEREKIKRKYKL